MSPRMGKRFWLWFAAWLAELAMRCYEYAGKKVVTEVGGGETSYTITNRPPEGPSYHRGCEPPTHPPHWMRKSYPRPR